MSVALYVLGIIFGICLFLQAAVNSGDPVRFIGVILMICIVGFIADFISEHRKIHKNKKTMGDKA